MGTHPSASSKLQAVQVGLAGTPARIVPAGHLLQWWYYGLVPVEWVPEAGVSRPAVGHILSQSNSHETMG